MADSQVLKALLPDNPLCGISTYKDTLNLATGVCTRQIKKLVLDGTEYWTYQANVLRFVMTINNIVVSGLRATPFFCTHYTPISDGRPIEDVPLNAAYLAAVELNTATLNIKIDTYTTAADFKAYLAAQYANGTPVTVWYILPTPTTETITVPTGLSGTEEGYLIQDGTPTPTNPIYPTANNVEIWLHSLRKLTTATEAVENPLYSDGTAITAYTIKGNTVQNGTPTPSNPVDVNGVGVRTEQLFDCLAKNTNNGYINDMRLNGTTGESAPTNYISEYIRVNAETTYTISGLPTTNNYNTSLAFYDNSYTVIDAVKYLNRNSFNFTTPLNTAFIRISVFNEIERGVMLNTGSTAKPFEPYGYKIPISINQQTTNIYLGSTQTVRQIKKLVLTGDETWYINNQGTVNAFFSMVLANPLNVNLGISTHFIFKGIYTSNDDVGFYATTTGDLRIRTDNVSSMTKSDFTTWLSQQYANGTPVTIWYVLATATTDTVNEPLMKIGTYADTLSNAASIPTIEGANSISVDTTVQPSEFTATWTGWHDASVKEWDGSDWQ